MGAGCLLRYNEERRVVCRKSRKELGGGKGKIRVLTSQPKSLLLRQHPHRIGVFLDWEAGDVSFYNMVDGSHIYSYTRIKFWEILHPYFSLQGPGTSVAIYLASDHTENCPDSFPKISVTRSRSSDKGVPQEANSVTSISVSPLGISEMPPLKALIVKKAVAVWRVAHFQYVNISTPCKEREAERGMGQLENGWENFLQWYLWGNVVSLKVVTICHRKLKTNAWYLFCFVAQCVLK